MLAGTPFYLNGSTCPLTQTGGLGVESMRHFYWVLTSQPPPGRRTRTSPGPIVSCLVLRPPLPPPFPSLETLPESRNIRRGQGRVGKYWAGHAFRHQICKVVRNFKFLFRDVLFLCMSESVFIFKKEGSFYIFAVRD